MKSGRKQPTGRFQGGQQPSAPQQVRIIGGQWKRTPLPVLNLPGLRPTPDRVRETVFNWINHLRAGNWSGVSCLDLFAGSGALGFEAASRGAGSVTLVELSRDAASRLETTRAKLNASQVTIMKADAVAAIHRLQQSRARFDVIFLDPPYGYGWISTILPLCVPLLAPDGMVYAESDQELPASGGDDDGVAVLPAWMDGWETARADKAGVVAFQLLKRKSMADFQA